MNLKKYMKHYLIILSVIFLCSCHKQKDNTSDDPQLNIENYTFAKEGGKISIYSKTNSEIHPYYISKEGETSEPIMNYWPGGYGLKSIDGGWYFISQDIDHKTINIEVKWNTEKSIREVPISIRGAGDFVHTKYIQLN